MTREVRSFLTKFADLPEYYPTRTEAAIMHGHAAEMAALLGEDTLLIEYGSGSSLKTRILLDRLPQIAGYVPMDISRDHLRRTATQLASSYPHLDISASLRRLHCRIYPADQPPACRRARRVFSRFHYWQFSPGRGARVFMRNRRSLRTGGRIVDRGGFKERRGDFERCLQ